MDFTDAETFALNEMIKRLKELPIQTSHSPHCFCKDEITCPLRCKFVKPTEWCLEPVRSFKTAATEFTKTILKQKMKYNNKKKELPTYIFVTINPKPTIELERFKNKIKTFVTSTIFADYLAVLEQRGTTSEALGKGFHAHILFKRHTPLSEGLPPTNIKQKINRSFKNFCIVSPHTINIQFITPDFAQDKYDYIIGKNKINDGKLEKQDGDDEWRKQNKIPDYLGNKNILQ